MEPAFVWCAFPSTDSAETVARAVLDERLAACANILPQIRSLFRWQGEIASADEVAVLFKTDTARLDALIARTAELHPYDTPAVAGWTAEATTPAVREWLASELGAT